MKKMSEIQDKGSVPCAVLRPVSRFPQSPTFDHHLVARAQARATGANAHDLCSLLASYYGFTELANLEPSFAGRLEEIERRLRIFCLTGEVPREELIAC